MLETGRKRQLPAIAIPYGMYEDTNLEADNALSISFVAPPLDEYRDHLRERRP